MNAATIRRCFCGEPLQTPVELNTGRCVVCHLCGPPPATPVPPPSRATVLALMAKHHVLQIAIRAQDRFYDSRDADRDSDDGHRVWTLAASARLAGPGSRVTT